MRLPGYEYSQPGSYFVTFCTKDRIESLASVGADHNIALSREGRQTSHRIPDHPISELRGHTR
jgi:hypothetical protein